MKFKSYLSIDTAANVITLALPNNVYPIPRSEQATLLRCHEPVAAEAMMTNGRIRPPRSKSANAREVIHIPVTVVMLLVRYTT